MERLKGESKTTTAETVEENQNDDGSYEALENLREKIPYWRSKLLDLSRRNRLISFKNYKTSTLLIRSPQPLENINSFLERRQLYIYKFPEADKKEGEVPAGQSPLFENTNEKDSKEELQETLPSGEELASDLLSRNIWLPDHTAEETESRLYTLYLRSRRSLREQGINTLFMAFGFLHYYEADHSDEELTAPLLLLPVSVDRIRESFKHKHSYAFTSLENDIQVNPALARKLVSDFGLDLPDFDTDMGVESWLDILRKAVQSQRRWSVQHSICIGTFAFEKLQMYLDIEEHIDRILDNPILRAFAGDPTKLTKGFDDIPSEEELDSKVRPEKMNHVLPVDSSQQVAIEAAKRGVSFVVQGPPGTGKSQTIVNIIAELLAQGKRILFVSQKMAALEVVKQRLEETDLADYCLDLHSHRANKREVLQQLERQLYHRKEVKNTANASYVCPRLQDTQQELNRYGEEILSEPNGRTSLYEARGNLASVIDAPSVATGSAIMDRLDEDTMRSYLRDLEGIEEYAAEMRKVKDFPWRDVEIKKLTFEVNSELRRIMRDLREARQEIESFISRSKQVVGVSPNSIQDFEHLGKLLAHCQEWSGAIALQEEWFRDDIEKKIENAKVIARNEAFITENVDYLLQHYDEAYFNLDANALLRGFKDLHKSPFRWFRPRFWRQRREISDKVSEILKDEHRSFRDKYNDLETLTEVKQKKQDNAKRKHQVEDLLPDDIDIETVDWQAFRDGLIWAHSVNLLINSMSAAPTRDRNIASLIKSVETREADLLKLAQIYSELYEENLKKDYEQLLAFFPAEYTLQEDPIDEAEIQKLLEWFAELDGTRPELRRWMEFVNAVDALPEPLQDYVSEFLDEGYPPESLVNSFQKDFWMVFLDNVENQTTSRTGSHYISRIHQFRDLDQKLPNLAKKRIVERLESDKPDIEAFSNTPSSELAILKREIKKERRHLPLRQLLARIPKLISVLKPCFMMSPLSVAQYINLDSVEPFDTIIFDEASQIMMEDAVSSLIRAKQAIIVGDSEQLPPTRFFRTFDDDPEIDEPLEDLSSLLDEASTILYEKYLKWHYRSRDETLVHFSNQEFYEGRLVTFPNSKSESGSTGVEHVYVEDAVYGRGKSRKNVKEAKKVADLVKRHIENSPEKSLGVVACSASQQRAIQEQIEILRRQELRYSDFFAESILDEFFVKNLETVQGDERDVIIFSIGYGPDETGRMTLNFGPINRKGGYKRLNVAVTRARERVYLVSSFQPEDIDLENTSNPSVIHLLNYMRYAKEGPDAIARTLRVSNDHYFESSFEEAVYDRLSAEGWDLATQVGCSGYRIDLAIKHPQQKGRYILGIECDGSAYHSSKTARDRDKVRQEVLEGLGWNIHRVWSNDWLREEDREVKKMEAEIEQVLCDERNEEDQETIDLFNSSMKRSELEIVEIRGNGDNKLSFQEYVPANLKKRSGGLEAFNRYGSTIDNQILETVRKEGPIHEELLIERVAHAWRIRRIGKNVRKTIRRRLRRVKGRKVSIKNGTVWDGPRQELAPVRISTKEQRPFKLVPLEELAWLAVELLKNAFSIDRDDLIVEIARCFGFSRTGSRIQAHVEKALKYLESIDKIREEQGRIELA